MRSYSNMTLTALLVALASALHALESFIPVPYVVPGAKLGLANIVALYAVMTMGLPQALTISFLRTILGSLIGGTFLNVSYYLSTAGAVVSTVIMYFLKVTGSDKLSVVGVSVAGACAHNMAQLLTAALILRQAGVLFYLPYLLLFAVPTGIFVGLLAQRVIRLSRHLTGFRR